MRGIFFGAWSGNFISWCIWKRKEKPCIEKIWRHHHGNQVSDHAETAYGNSVSLNCIYPSSSKLIIGRIHLPISNTLYPFNTPYPLLLPSLRFGFDSRGTAGEGWFFSFFFKCVQKAVAHHARKFANSDSSLWISSSLSVSPRALPCSPRVVFSVSTSAES